MKDDRAHAQQLLRGVAIINARTERELGPLPPGGLPIVPKRKPILPERKPPQAAITADDLGDRPHTDEETDMYLTRVAATVALAAVTSLSACAADQEATSGPSVAQTPVARIADTVVVPPPDAAFQDGAPAAALRDAEGKDRDPGRGPPIHAAQLKAQILDLLSSFQSLEDLEKENIEKRIKARLSKQVDMADGYDYFGKTSEGWNYRVAVARLARLDEPPTIQIYLNNGVAPWTDQQPTYCTLDFEEVAKELVAMGYEQGARPRAAGGAWMWGFGRDSVDKKTSFGVGVVVYEWPLLNGSKQVCIKGFDIGGGINND
jgi:hypothetical protein